MPPTPRRIPPALIPTGLLNSRINRRLLVLALVAAASGSAVLALVSGVLSIGYAVRESEQRAIASERDLTVHLTSYGPVDDVQNQLQLLVASGDLRRALVVDAAGTVIASGDSSQVDLPLARVARISEEGDFNTHLAQCLPPHPRRDCFGDNLSFTDGPLPVFGGDHLLRFTQVPLALQGRGGYGARATLITETDLRPSIMQALQLGVWVFATGLVALSIACGLLVLVVRRRLLPELFDLAQTDSLSGLANRRSFHELARHRLDQAAERHHVNVLALIDVDRFKTINDSYGHGVGDEVVRYIADFLAQAVRRTDVVGRIGGDEFALLIDATPHQATELMERLRLGVASKPYKLPDGRHVALSLSIGMASTNGTGGYLLQPLMQMADASLYVAKDQGRNRVVNLEQQAPGAWTVGYA